MAAAHLRLFFVALLLLCSACGQGETIYRAEREADQAWEAYQALPDRTNYELFIQKNRIAARHHVSDGAGGSAHDTKGIRYQVRAVEVQSREASRGGDLQVATSVSERVDELESTEMLDLYEERLPGARERLLSARERVLPMLSR